MPNGNTTGSRKKSRKRRGFISAICRFFAIRTSGLLRGWQTCTPVKSPSALSQVDNHIIGKKKTARFYDEAAPCSWAVTLESQLACCISFERLTSAAEN